MSAPQIFNLGIASFLEAFEDSRATYEAIDWRPPARGDARIGWTNARLLTNESIDRANAEAVRRIQACSPSLAGVSIASREIPFLNGKKLLHAGPPLHWDRAAGPVRGALVGAVLWEGWAKSADEAADLISNGNVELRPCHAEGAVGPMAGVVSPNMPVWIVRDKTTGRKALSNFNEGLGKVLRFGANGEDVLDRLTWMRQVLFPTLEAAFSAAPVLELKPLMARALQMGDELHNRNAAASALFYRHLVPLLLDADVPKSDLSATLAFVGANDHFFLNLSMATSKLMMDSARGVEGSTVCTAMARNGTDFGIQIAGLGDRWFTSAAPVVDGLFFSPYGPQDAAPDLGDSAITETAGLGGMSLAAAPAIVRFVGGTSALATETTVAMSEICVTAHTDFSIPSLDFQGSPLGIDARLVVDLNRPPVINTGIAHKKAGIGQIGAGITHAPLECFERAVEAMGES